MQFKLIFLLSIYGGLFNGQAQVLYDETFLTSKHWVVEQQPGGTVIFQDKTMEIKDVNGCTIWFKHEIESPVKIEYDAIVIDEGGPQDRVSDLNCFWMATDPQNPDDFFRKSPDRAGKFENYHPLNLYYVGYGGHNNTKTRFRRYDGNTDRPLLAKHDLSGEKFMIVPNNKIHVTLVAYDSKISYARNGEVIFEISDKEPYKQGYFGIRTVNNHMIIKNLKISTLK